MKDTVKKWCSFKKACDALSRPKERWIFRGQQSIDWKLATSLERILYRVNPGLADPLEAEAFLLREFKRHFHRYSQSVPDYRDNLEWLALMQHHGAPTRLLDWTFSEYVALFFAIEGVSPGHECVVWAVNQTRCWKKFKHTLPERHQRRIEKDDKDRKTLNWVLAQFDHSGICPVNPFRLNERLAVQRGTFLLPLNPYETFEDNFKESIQRDKSMFKKIKIKCSREFLKESLTELQKMNISHITLFPGIDGFARSLNTTVFLPHLWPQS